MKKKLIALALATAMIASQFMGAAEVFAVGAVNRHAGEVLGLEGANLPAEPANGGVVPPNTTQEKKAILKNDGVFERDPNTNQSNGTAIQDAQLDTITDLVVAAEVITVPERKFQNKTKLKKLTFENAATNTTTTTLSTSAFEGTGITEVVLPKGLTSISNDVFKNAAALSKVVIGPMLTDIGNFAFQGTTNLTKLDLRNAAGLQNIGVNAFKSGGLKDLYIGKNTRIFTAASNALISSGTNKTVHFKESSDSYPGEEDGNYLGNADRVTLEANWTMLKQADKGGWRFFDEKGTSPPAEATTDYSNMELTGLAQSTKYNIVIEDISVVDVAAAEGTAGNRTVRSTSGNSTADQTPEDPNTITTNDQGKVKIRKAWSNKKVKITTPATATKLESDSKDITINTIYTVTVNNTEHDIATVGRNMSITAPTAPSGESFTHWTATGLNLTEEALKADPLTFAMPAGHVTLTANYSVATPPTPADKKAILTNTGVYERNLSTNEPTQTVITNLEAIQDLLIDDSVIEVPNNKFEGKTNITKLTFENAESNTTTTTIGTAAFKGIKAADVVLPKGLTTIKASAFENTGITAIELPDSLTTLEESAFKNAVGLTKAVVGSKLVSIENGAFEGTSALTTLDLRKAEKLAGMHTNAFKNSGLRDMIIGNSTKVFADQGAIFADTSTGKTVHFKSDNETYLEGSDIAALEKKWAALKTSDRGSWAFFSTRGEAPTTAATDYAEMQLTGLTPDTKYNVAVEDKPSTSRTVAKANAETNRTSAKKRVTDENKTTAEDAGTITADNQGNVKIKKTWSNKKIKITTPATTEKLESDPKEINIDTIYTVTVDEAESDIGTAGRRISVTAPMKDGYTFTGWTVPTGVIVDDPTQATITFTMPAQDVALTTNYEQTTPEVPAAPSASVDYSKMKLTGLTPSATYKVTVEGTPANITADSEGTIDILKGWSGKTIQLTIPATDSQPESAAKNIDIQTIYTITVGDKERISVQGQRIMIKADIPAGHKFNQWTVAGVNLEDATKETITFEMPGNDVTLTPSYTQIVTTKPEDLIYDGNEEVSVKLEVSRAEFKGIEVNGKMLEENKDYTVAEAKGVTPSAASGIIVTFTKAYMDTLKSGDQTFKAVLTTGTVDFSVKVTEKPAKPTVTYPDVKEDEWFYEAVMYVSGKEIMSGYADGTFGPADKLARGQFATILYRIAGSPTVEYKNIFSDVPEGQFYSLPAIWAQTNNVITGYADGKFGPSDSITREQLATMLYRYAMMKGTDVSARVDLNTYPDAGKVSEFAKDAMSWVVAKGIIKGDQGNLNPQGDSSRAVVATMIQRFQTGK